MSGGGSATYYYYAPTGAPPLEDDLAEFAYPLWLGQWQPGERMNAQFQELLLPYSGGNSSFASLGFIWEPEPEHSVVSDSANGWLASFPTNGGNFGGTIRLAIGQAFSDALVPVQFNDDDVITDSPYWSSVEDYGGSLPALGPNQFYLGLARNRYYRANGTTNTIADSALSMIPDYDKFVPVAIFEFVDGTPYLTASAGAGTGAFDQEIRDLLYIIAKEMDPGSLELEGSSLKSYVQGIYDLLYNALNPEEEFSADDLYTPEPSGDPDTRVQDLLQEGITDRWTEYPFGNFQLPIGADRNAFHTWTFALPLGELASGFGASGIASDRTLVVNFVKVHSYVVILRNIIVLGMTLWGIGRIWEETRRVA
jgi:hypothetical protein